MIDVFATIRAYLVAQSGVTAQFGSRIYMGEAEPPNSANYKPSDGAALCIVGQGGQPSFDGAAQEPRLMVKVYGATPAVAMTAYRAYVDAMDGAALSAKVMAGYAESYAMQLREPDTDWPYVLEFRRVLIREDD